MAHKLQNTFVEKNISKMYLHCDSADINFLFPNEEIKVWAHKSILTMASPVFAAMFFGPMKENRIVIMVDATSSAFKEFLQFFYQSEVTLTMENIDAVARLADKYEMLECVNACASYVKSNLSKNTMIWGYQLAVALKNESLQKFCEENIQTYKSDIFQSNAFLRCDKTIIEHILNMETLFCDEFDLFKACIEWARSVCRGHGLNENDPKTVRKQLGTCFQLIRFGTMDRKDVSEILSNHLYQELFTREELVEIMCAAYPDMMTLLDTRSRSLPIFKWDGTQSLIISRTESSNDRNVYIKRRESTWFSTSVPLLLGGTIEFAPLRNFENNRYPNSTTTIFEHCDKTSGNNGSPKELCKETPSETSYIRLAQTIIIRPKKLYEIRWETTSEKSNIYHNYVWKRGAKLDENSLITFDNDCDCGMVSLLAFNRI